MQQGMRGSDPTSASCPGAAQGWDGSPAFPRNPQSFLVTRAEAHTEQSCGRVWMQPELSFWTQQPEPRSRSRSRWMSLSTCWSFRMHGENLAPRWIRSIWEGDARKGEALSVYLPSLQPSPERV